MIFVGTGKDRKLESEIPAAESETRKVPWVKERSPQGSRKVWDESYRKENVLTVTLTQMKIYRRTEKVFHKEEQATRKQRIKEYS